MLKMVVPSESVGLLYFQRDRTPIHKSNRAIRHNVCLPYYLKLNKGIKAKFC